MSYFVTGATGFIGRHLVEQLVAQRAGHVFVLVRKGSKARMDRLIQHWGSGRVTMVVGDLSKPALGVSRTWISKHTGSIDHVFHLAAVYDLTADDAANEAMNVHGTRHALALAERVQAACFHQVSSMAVAGDHRGRFDETMFDVGQRLPSPYHRTKYESEKLVREQSAVPWRVYRPSIVVGHSGTGAMDKVDGPYYFFPLLKRLRDTLPGWLPLVGIDVGDTNVVPVDYVAAAMDHLAHLPGLDGRVFHLVNPEPQPVVDVVNTLCAAAQAPRFARPFDRGIAGQLRRGITGALARPAPLPRSLQPASVALGLLRLGPVKLVLEQSIGRLGIPPEVLGHVGFPSVFDSRRTEEALADSSVVLPPLDDYAAQLWSYWEDHLDPSTGDDPEVRATLHGRHVVITGASSGIGRVTALKVAQAGGIPVLVARGKDKLEDVRTSIEQRGGIAHVYPCDLSDMDAIDDLCGRLAAELPPVDFVVNNAGRSIRRSLRLSLDRFHDLERTMQLNYFGAVRLVMGLLPGMLEQRSGHVVNVSSIGVQTSPPRFSAYVASKSALDSWSNVVSSELVADGVTFTSIHMPLVKTPMIAPTKLYDRFPTISPAQAADHVIRALVERPHEINTVLGNAGAVAHTLAPKAAFRVLNLAYQVFPDSTAARSGDGEDAPDTLHPSEQIVLARMFRGVHW